MKLVAVVLLVVVLVSCQGRGTGSNTAHTGTSQAASEVNSDSLLQVAALEVITVLHNERAEMLAPFIHPGEGVRFSPYGYVDTLSDVQLSRKDFLSQLGTEQIVNWGTYDGSGEPIHLTTRDYFRRFVYTSDFLHTKSVKLNGFIGGGNSLNNLEVCYPGCSFVEYHVPGTNPSYGGMDWNSLRLVFRMHKGKYYLVGMVHDQWTI